MIPKMELLPVPTKKPLFWLTRKPAGNRRLDREAHGSIGLHGVSRLLRLVLGDRAGQVFVHGDGLAFPLPSKLKIAATIGQPVATVDVLHVGHSIAVQRAVAERAALL